jgi:hypothetical protein
MLGVEREESPMDEIGPAMNIGGGLGDWDTPTALSAS